MNPTPQRRIRLNEAVRCMLTGCLCVGGHIASALPLDAAPPSVQEQTSTVYTLGWSEWTPGSEMWSEGDGYLIAGEILSSAQDDTVLTGGGYTLLPGSGTHVASPPIEMLTGNLYLRRPTSARIGELSTLLLHGATTGADVVFTCDIRRGFTELAGCVGVAVELNDPQIVDRVTADEQGMARLSLIIPRDAADRPVIFQAVEQESCRVSNPVVCTFR